MIFGPSHYGQISTTFTIMVHYHHDDDDDHHHHHQQPCRLCLDDVIVVFFSVPPFCVFVMKEGVAQKTV